MLKKRKGNISPNALPFTRKSETEPFKKLLIRFSPSKPSLFFSITISSCFKQELFFITNIRNSNRDVWLRCKNHKDQITFVWGLNEQLVRTIHKMLLYIAGKEWHQGMQPCLHQINQNKTRRSDTRAEQAHPKACYS